MQYTVNTRHESNYPDPIQFTPGDRLVLGRRDDQYPGWVRVTISSGSEGWAPESRIRVESEHEGVATADYDARELDTRVGERVICIEELHGWLLVQNEDGQTGWIPKETASPA